MSSNKLPVIQRSIVLSTEVSLNKQRINKRHKSEIFFCSIRQVSSSLGRELSVKPNLSILCQLFSTSLVCSENLSLPSDRTTEVLVSGSEKFEHQDIFFAFICDHKNYVGIDEKILVFSAFC
jgi:hypothetical protein